MHTPVGILLADAALRGLLPPTHHLRVQCPVALGFRSLPEPDIAIVVGGPRDYALSHPSTATLIVEIAESSLRLDRHAKASLYARAGVPEYWIVNLPDRVLEVHRDPVEKISPLIAPERPISVADMLPRRSG